MKDLGTAYLMDFYGNLLSDKQRDIMQMYYQEDLSLSEIAAERGQTLAEMALAWILRDGKVTSVLIGASKPSQILDNIKAAENLSFT